MKDLYFDDKPPCYIGCSNEVNDKDISLQLHINKYYKTSIN